MNDLYAPVSQRLISGLRTRANEFRGMAETATTTDVMAALLRLAHRYDALADKRGAEQTSDDGFISTQTANQDALVSKMF